MKTKEKLKYGKLVDCKGIRVLTKLMDFTFGNLNGLAFDFAQLSDML